MDYKKKYLKYKSKYVQLKQFAGGNDPIDKLYQLMKENYNEDIKKLKCINSSMDIKLLIAYYIEANLTKDSSDFFHLCLVRMRKDANMLERKGIFEKYEISRLGADQNQRGIISVQQDMIRIYLAAIVQNAIHCSVPEVFAFVRFFGCNVNYNNVMYEFNDSIDNIYTLPELSITDQFELNNPNHLPKCILAEEARSMTHNDSRDSFGIRLIRSLDIKGETLSI
jgi:hypothetical protein